MTTILAPDFVTRSPTRDDAQAIVDLIVAHDIAAVGEPDFEMSMLMRDWNAPGFDLTKDAQIVVTPEGLIAGYESILGVLGDGRIQIDGYVHPGYQGQGIGTYLLRWAETRARERIPELPDNVRVCTHAGIYGNAPAMHDLFQNEGYSVVRRFWRMEIDLTEPPPSPKWPNGITVRPFVRDQDEYAVWQAVNDIFSEDWEYAELTFEEWVAAKISADEDFDPSLWFLAVAGDQIAGMARCSYRMDSGWIRTLGVCSPFRRQGLAMALLHHSFGECYRRGKRTVGLGVDSQNPTGATQLYERAGMHIAEVIDTCEKELWEGK
ncbi:MAG: GNAT family N-acetyltransferase [Aggregatilineales bacterium]